MATDKSGKWFPTLRHETSLACRDRLLAVPAAKLQALRCGYDRDLIGSVLDEEWIGQRPGRANDPDRVLANWQRFHHQERADRHLIDRAAVGKTGCSCRSDDVVMICHGDVEETRLHAIGCKLRVCQLIHRHAIHEAGSDGGKGVPFMAA